MDVSTFGSYGVLRFMRRHEETVIASYPIDDDELTFGCDPSCGVRLYYPTVSPLHAKIFFQERKAFIQVIGVHGLLVDKCQVFPVSATTHTTVPLTNNSELEISKKRFRFEYPPKALRPILTFTPPPQTSKSARKRVLRLSMIQSAQVFTPCPDPDPHVNLRVLQTPIRLNSSPLKHVHSTPTPPGQAQADQEEGQDGIPIRLVEGNRPQVVEEEQDLVILEEVDAPEPLPQVNSASNMGGVGPSGPINPMQTPMRGSHTGGPPPNPSFPLPPPHQFQQFQTPQRRPGRSSLHRAVLIRSAQRAVMQIEMEKEQEQEEREVEEHVTPGAEPMDLDEEDEDDRDAVIDEFDEDFHEDDDGLDVEPDPRPRTPVFGWRNGLEAFKTGLQALRSRSQSPEKNALEERDVAEERLFGFEDDDDHSPLDDGDQTGQDWELQAPEEEEDLGDVPPAQETGIEIAVRADSVPHQFTPQRPPRHLYFMTPQVTKPSGTLSLADRLRGRRSTSTVGRASLVRWREPEVAVPDMDQTTPSQNAEPLQPRVSESERQAIKERRRSALAQPDAIFGENIPGSRRNSLGPGTPGGKAVLSFTSPSKAWTPIKEDEEEAETTTLLEKMKEVVEGMQRRRSMQAESIAKVSAPNGSEEGGENAEQQDETLEDEDDWAKEPVPVRADSHTVARSLPATPRMSDLKHVFSEKHTANIPPTYAGVRNLFRAERVPVPETPHLDGVREMFFRARVREPSTPNFDSVGEMLTTPLGYDAPEITERNGVETESTMEAHASTLNSKRPGGKPMASDRPVKPGTRIPTKMTGARRMGHGRATPTDTEQLADDEETPDIPPVKPAKQNAKAATLRRTNRRIENEPKEETNMIPIKLAGRGEKVVTPEAAEHAHTQREAANPARLPVRRSRTATKSTDSTTTASEPAEPSKSTRKTMQRTKAGTAPAASSELDVVKPELEAESSQALHRGGTRKRSQSVEVEVVIPLRTPAKRRVGAKSKKAADGAGTQDAAAAEGGVRLGRGAASQAADRAELPKAPTATATTTRARRGKTKSATETEDEGAGTGALRVTRGRRTAAGTAVASSRATGDKGRTATAGAGAASSGKNAVRGVVEKENTPERIHVKEEEEEKVPLALPQAAVKGARARKAPGAAVAKALSEPEKDGPAVKTRAPRTRAASGRK